MPPIRNNGAAERRAEGAAELPTTHNASQALAFPQGPWILRSKAQAEFALAPSDLDSILPVEISPNPYGKRWPMKKYNWCDVRDLADRLKPTFGPNDLAEEDGQQIERDSAMQMYWLKDCQMDRIKPTVVHGIDTYYNTKDVEILAERIDYAAEHPTGRPRPANYVHHEEDFNILNGISNEDANDWLYRLTGIAIYTGGEDDYDLEDGGNDSDDSEGPGEDGYDNYASGDLEDLDHPNDLVYEDETEANNSDEDEDDSEDFDGSDGGELA